MHPALCRRLPSCKTLLLRSAQCLALYVAPDHCIGGYLVLIGEYNVLTRRSSLGVRHRVDFSLTHHKVWCLQTLVRLQTPGFVVGQAEAYSIARSCTCVLLQAFSTVLLSSKVHFVAGSLPCYSSHSLGTTGLQRKLNAAPELSNVIGTGPKLVQIARSTPGLVATLVGHKSKQNVLANVALSDVQPLTPQQFKSVMSLLTT